LCAELTQSLLLFRDINAASPPESVTFTLKRSLVKREGGQKRGGRLKVTLALISQYIGAFHSPHPFA
jgi:hypothetical protein